MTVTAIDTRQPSAALAIRPGQQTWTEDQEAALAQIGLKDAPNGDRMVFLHQCQRTGLDPFARQIYMIGRKEKRNEKRNGNWVDVWETKWTIQTGIDGWRVIRDRAERRENVRVKVGRAIWYDEDGNEYKVWVRHDPPAACEITLTVIDVAGNETPYTSVLQYAEYVQTKEQNGQQRPVAQWATKKAHMLEKCTEADVYRKAFPQDFSGVHLDDAMPAPEPEPVPENGRSRGRVTIAEVVERGPVKPPPQLLGVIAGHYDRLGISEEDECLSWTSKLAGHEVTAPDDLTGDEAKSIARQLNDCKNLGDLQRLTGDGEKPGGESDG
jgi:phage recombination protein Bet